MIKVSDYIFQTLESWGTRHVFLVTGGGAMHLNDAAGKQKSLQFVCNHHEQACAIAAEGYARVDGRMPVVCVTSGPGGTNALTGVMGAWTDSIPMLVLSGQVKRETCTSHHPERQMRQLGDQEIDIVSIVRRITKYCCFVSDPREIRYQLEKAYRVAQSGRPGPCWLDIPLDVQGAAVDQNALRAYDPEEDEPRYDFARAQAQCTEILERLERAERPVILAGSGIRQSRSLCQFERVIRKLGIPVVLSRTAHDLLVTDDPLRCGRAGIDADRAGNLAVQNSDLLLVLGCRLGIRQVGYNYGAFARQAFRVQVDIDPTELEKPTVRVHLPVHCDLKVFLEEMERQLAGKAPHEGRSRSWLEWCKERVRRYPGVLPRHCHSQGPVNPYRYLEILFEHLQENEVIVSGNGAAFIMSCHAGRLKRGQRMFFNSGTASMGYDLPAAIGAAFARPGQRIVCIAGDGSIQMNLQELQTIVHHKLPIKIFVLNNGGYLSIRTTQLGFFGLLVGESPQSGVSFPDFLKVAAAYGIPAARVDSQDCHAQIERALEAPGPALVEARVDPNQQFEPRMTSRQLADGRIVSPPLEDMYPFLDREELASNMLIPMVEA